jgi:hypothetical protein
MCALFLESNYDHNYANQGRRLYDPMSDWASETMYSWFAPFNQKLEKLLGQEFLWEASVEMMLRKRKRK